MIKAIIFDLDNTIIDFMKMKKISCEQAIDAMIDGGLDMTKKKALEELYDIYYKEGLEDDKIFQKFLKKVMGKVDYKILSYGIIAYRNARNGFLMPYPGTKRTLIKLREKGIRLGILSDAPKLKAWIRLSTMKLDDFFDELVAFEDTKRIKPAKEPFELILKKMKLKPEECLMVGDNPDRDLKGAKRIGMKTCFAKYGYSLRKKLTKKVKTDYTIKKIEELVDIV